MSGHRRLREAFLLKVRKRPLPAFSAEEVWMTELPLIIKMNIAHYEAMLKRNISADKRAQVNGLLAEAKIALVQARHTNNHEPPER